MSRTAPHHRRTTTAEDSTSHRRATRHEASARASHHAAKKPTLALTKQDKKNQRFCATLTHRKALRNSACRKLEKQRQHEAVQPHQLTKQEKKDERRCSGLSLRQVMRDSRCRKVAERQLASTSDRSAAKSSKHRHGMKAAKRHETAATHHRASKHRRR
jgi:hypothetical protein